MAKFLGVNAILIALSSAGMFYLRDAMPVFAGFCAISALLLTVLFLWTLGSTLMYQGVKELYRDMNDMED